MLLRVKALWVDSKIISSAEWSPPLHNGDYGDKAAITHIVVDVVGVDPIYNRLCNVLI